MQAAKKVVPMSVKSPQVEDGHIRIANELYDAILAYPFTARQQKVLSAIMRKTYGYNKKVDDISASQIAEMSGLHRSHVTATIISLQALNVITKAPGVFGSILGINKDFSTWVEPEKSARTESVHGTETVHPVPKQLSGCTETVQVGGTETVHTITNFPKDNLQQTKDIPLPQAAGPSVPSARVAKPKGKAAMTAELRERFERFYAAYPRKTDRRDAEAAFVKLNPDEPLLAELLEALKREKAAGKHADRQYIKHPATWLNKGSWMDDIQTEYTAEQRGIIEDFNEALGEALGYMDADVFSESRASALDDFKGLLDRPEFWKSYFPYVREKCDLPPGVGMDYLISRDGFTKVKGGQHERKA